MTRYKDDPLNDDESSGYREGVDRVLEYIASTNAYPKLLTELVWAIKEGII